MTPPEASELADWLRLTLLPGIGGISQRNLLQAIGLPDQIFSASHAELAAVVGHRLAAIIHAPPPDDVSTAIEKTLAWTSEPSNALIHLADPRYPQSLLTTPDPPSLLYAKGNLELLSHRSIAIVGSRNATPGGIKNSGQFARALSEHGYCIVSGLALGIDAAAHEGALATNGKTIAVIGTGADRVYPARNQALARRIVENGLILSEFQLGTSPHAANFPRRNRIISGLTLGVLVVEAALESGSLITARLAGDQGREVFAIPGSIHSPLSKGCHLLIKQGAKLVESASDVLEELKNTFDVSTQTASSTVPKDPTAAPAVSDEILQNLALLGHDPFTIDEIALRTGLTAEFLLAMLLELELSGQVAALSGGRYQRLS